MSIQFHKCLLSSLFDNQVVMSGLSKYVNIQTLPLKEMETLLSVIGC